MPHSSLALLALLLFWLGIGHACCNGCDGNSTAPREKMVFDTSSTIVENEFIVKFSDYFAEKARQSFLEATLKDKHGWKIIPKDNPASGYPSDFDLLKIWKDVHAAKNLLVEHPYILKVVPNHRVTRTLKFVPFSSTTGDHSDIDTCSSSSVCNTDKESAYDVPEIVENFLGTNSGVGSLPGRRIPLGMDSFWDAVVKFQSRGLRKVVPRQIARALKADKLWSRGFTGQGVKVAVFDTGLAADHPHFKKGTIRERTDWTGAEGRKGRGVGGAASDGVGHGTFVAGVIASARDCLGLAPDAELHAFRVFTDEQISYTSWFLDAFNYALVRKIRVLNLSIGGPDFRDDPFVEKVWELTANGVILISAIGNDGPLYGTLNNPADQMDVIGVGGVDYDDRVASFSSRGMTAWESPTGGYGRAKPDIVAYGTSVRASSAKVGCRTLSGTSVASPVVAGAVALLISAVTSAPRKGGGLPPAFRAPPLSLESVSPASIKQVLMSTAVRLPEHGLFEQGAGRIDLIEAFEALRRYKPHVTMSPPYIDFTECPYMWPYCSQPLFYTAMPVVVNITIINGLGVTGRIVGQPRWQPFTPLFGLHLDMAFSYGDGMLWPWSGYMAIHLSVGKSGREFEGVAEGQVSVTIESPAPLGEKARRSTVLLPVRVRIIPTPPRRRRLLWDQYHNLGYPPGYFPRDNLRVKRDPLDWNGDHPHTNFRAAYTALRARGFYMDVLSAPYTCFDASRYGALLLVDPEEEFHRDEIDKLRHDVLDTGLALVVVADWFNTSVMRKVKFYDESTRQWWVPDTGGANIPALNDLLAPFGMAFGDRVLEGHYRLAGHEAYYASGSSITRFPANGLLWSFTLRDQGQEVLTGKSSTIKRQPILGMYANASSPQAGRIALYGDSSCLDSAHASDSNPPVPNCFWLLSATLEYLLFDALAPALRDASTNPLPPILFPPLPSNSNNNGEQAGMSSAPIPLPRRLDGKRLQRFSKVLADSIAGVPPRCPSPLQYAEPSPLDKLPPNEPPGESPFDRLHRRLGGSGEGGDQPEDGVIGSDNEDDGEANWLSAAAGAGVSVAPHDHDADPTTFFLAVAVLSIIIVIVVVINYARESRAKRLRLHRRFGSHALGGSSRRP